MMNLKGKTVLVTGASSGIGAAIAVEAAGKGARVILIARNEEKLKTQLEKLSASSPPSSYYVTDLSDLDAVKTVSKEILQDVGCPDVIINNAGAGQWKSFQETETEEIVSMMKVPYFAAVAITKEFLPEMLERKSGSIINMTSAASFLTWPSATGYVAARWAVRGFTEALRHDLKESGITVALAVFAKVSSEYWVNNPGSEDKLPKRQSWIPTMTSGRVAEVVVRGIEKRQTRIVHPLLLRLFLFWGGIFPGMVK